MVTAFPLEAYLAWYVPQCKRALGQFLTAKRRAAARSPEIREAVERVSTILAGGKKLRGALVQLGYECAGGKRAFLPASLAYELAHAFLLIHDDIMDRAAVRRGVPALHVSYASRFARSRSAQEAAHLGESVAMTLGDQVFFWALEMFATTPVPPERLARALRELGTVLEETSHGQLLDLLAGWRAAGGPATALAIAERKTARYSVIGPLVLGAILGGGKSNLLRALRRFGQPLGVAFQLGDDLLGLYGDERTIGKSPLSDLREGKPTYLVATAYRRASARHRVTLRACWGKRTAGRADLAAVRAIVERTGARAATKALLRRLVRRSTRAVPSITKQRSLAETLRSLAAFFEERRS